ncbi:hypothetical protein IV38_GL001351 [Lactobacillus selangorensis]|uniref:Glycosyltransferase 2-like domain-containing protein n=1 Tax=Lactobacillus selangorensis TaxID=81857 RepID=A0A0R2FII6_9LACO|nr:glycosyltransferase family 2 protein [Lactobacillus selangorensis]KRN28352.1 hypothetical protein IV38_GL001351 [Lactobacillus selangorensis]KRN31854.1 hypothetical protein IV40_GL001138 [Lactobacillus selangorensis]
MNELVSIIVPIYNAAASLERCLNSILSQTYEHLEIILVDDGSSDNSLQIEQDFKKSDQRIRLLKQANSGQSRARNQALNVSTGSYIVFVDSDDYIASDYIKQMLFIATKTKAGMVACQYQEFFDGKRLFLKRQHHFRVKTLSAKGFFKRLGNNSLPGNIDVSAHSKLYASYLFTDVRFPENKTFEEPFIFFNLVEKASKVAFTDYTGYFYNRRVGSTVNAKFSLKRLDYVDGEKVMYQKITHKYPDLINTMNLRKTHVLLNNLGHIALSSDKQFKSLEIEYKHKVLKQNVFVFLGNPSSNLKDKLGIVILIFGGLPTFQFVSRTFKKIQSKL